VTSVPVEVTHTCTTAPELATTLQAHARVRSGELCNEVSALDRGIPYAGRVVERVHFHIGLSCVRATGKRMGLGSCVPLPSSSSLFLDQQ
jgi:hypothetical protein